MESLSIIILNFNTFHLTCDCIASIYKADLSNLDIEVIVVDNGSTEVTQASFSQLFPKILLIESSQNLGFAKGNNLGIQHATKANVLLLNSDTIITDPLTFSKCLLKLKEFNGKIILTTKLLTKDGVPQVAYHYLPSVWLELLLTTFVYKILPKSFRENLLIDFKADVNRVVRNGYVTATFLLFRKSLLQKIKGKKLYDEIFLYGEELFWASQAIDVGYQPYYFAEVNITHLIGASSKQASSYSSETRKTRQIQGEDLFLRWRYSSIVTAIIYFLRLIRFSILSFFDVAIRIRLRLLITYLFKFRKLDSS